MDNILVFKFIQRKYNSSKVYHNLSIQIIQWYQKRGNNRYDELLMKETNEFLSLSMDNRTLSFHPFPSTQYSSSIHATVYKCTAKNEAGLISSPDIDLRAGMVNII